MIRKHADKLRRILRRSFSRVAFKHYLGGLYHRIDEHHVFLLAGGLAFSLFVCVIPLVLIIFSTLGSMLEKPSITDEINAFIDNAIPYKEYAEHIKELIVTRVIEFREFENVARVIGIIGLLFAASGLFSSMRTILNMIYKSRKGEPVLLGKLRDLGLILLVLVYFLLSTTVLPGISIVTEMARNTELLERFIPSWAEDIVVSSITFGIIFMSFLVVYYLVPYERPNRRVYVVSALAAAILWELAKQGFGYYITNFATLRRVYGAYALTIISGFWIYYTSLVFVLGAEIGQLYRERRRARLGLPPRI